MNSMNTVKESQELTIGKYKCKVFKTSNWWCSIEPSSVNNQKIFTQFDLTKQDIWNVLGYAFLGDFPQCKTAEDLTKVIEFIMSKDSTNQIITKVSKKFFNQVK